jgi:hypothetical protein
MKLKFSNGGGTVNILSLEREYRPCDINQTNAQVGRMNILAISGGRQIPLKNAKGETVGVAYPIDASRRVEVVLDWDDTYIVSRVRYITKGQKANTEEVEQTFSGIFCDYVGEIAYQASCWK